MTSILEKGGAGVEGAQPLLCENPLAPRNRHCNAILRQPIPKPQEGGPRLARAALNTARTAPFVAHHQRYDAWFERHAAAYLSELLAVRALLPWKGLGLSIGVGTGRFTAPLGVQVGIDPAREALGYAQARGVSVVQGIAEALPCADARFARLLSVTTLCFVDDAAAMLAEAYRVLEPGGALVLGIIDRDNGLGQDYLAHQTESVFYCDATFYAGAALHQLLCGAGFGELAWLQTLSRPLAQIREIEPLRPGRGEGTFVAVRALRPQAVPTTARNA